MNNQCYNLLKYKCINKPEDNLPYFAALSSTLKKFGSISVAIKQSASACRILPRDILVAARLL